MEMMEFSAVMGVMGVMGRHFLWISSELSHSWTGLTLLSHGQRKVCTLNNVYRSDETKPDL
jgi:hypothetical protein